MAEITLPRPIGCRRCWIIPPFVLEEIVRHGTAEQRAWALDTLSQDASIRAARLHRALFPLPVSATGEREPQVPGVVRRTIFDAHHAEDADALDVARAEGQSPVSDLAVNEAYQGLGATHSFYWQVLERDSIDDAGMALEGVVHYGVDFDNAMWDGARMIFGDGDGQILTRTTAAIDVIGHELTHGVTQYTANLTYMGQSGALNESISDVFGILIKQRHQRLEAHGSDWLIGLGIVGPVLGGGALRSMSAPGTAYPGDPQVANLRDYVRTASDNGGVHINSGIPNRAFYEVAMSLGGFAWEKAGRIWYSALRSPDLSPHAQFHDFAALTVNQAQRLFGSDSFEATSVREAWRSVGVN